MLINTAITIQYNTITVTLQYNKIIDGLEMCGLFLDYCDVSSALSFCTLILTAPIHCRGSTVILQIHFGWTIPLNPIFWVWVLNELSCAKVFCVRLRLADSSPWRAVVSQTWGSGVKPQGLINRWDSVMCTEVLSPLQLFCIQAYYSSLTPLTCLLTMKPLGNL